MNDGFDEHLRRALSDELDAPPHGEGFDDRLWARLEREGAQEAGLEPAPRTQVPRGSPWPRRVLAVAAAVAAALAVAALLTGAPGRGSLSVAPASAEERALRRIDQGLASLSSLRATVVEMTGVHTDLRFTLAVAADGSRRCEAVYYPRWDLMRQRWKEQREQYAQQDQPFEPLDGKVELRSLTTVDMRTRTFMARTTFADVVTRRVWGTAFGRTVNAGTADLVDGAGPAVLANVGWGDPAAGYLNTAYAVRAALDSKSGGVRVREVVWRGRPAYEVVTSRTNEWGMYAWVDRETGILLETRTPASRGWPAVRTVVTSFSVDEPLPRRLFTMEPVYDLMPDGSKPAPTDPDLSDYTLDLGSRTTTLDELPNALGFDPLVPASAPAGYRLAAVEVSGDGMLIGESGGGWGYTAPNDYPIPPRGTLVYRKGLTAFIVRSAPTLAVFPALADPLEDGTHWHDFSRVQGYGNYVTLRHGYYAGFPVDMPRDPMGVWWTLVIARRPVGVEVSGGLTRAQLVGVLESLNPPGVAGDYRPPYVRAGRVAFVAAVAGLAATCVLVAVGRRRRAGAVGTAFGTPGWVTVAGAALALLGVSLPWYAFLEAGQVVWALRGREDAFGLAVATCAVAAVAAALWRPVLGSPASWAARLFIVGCGGLAAAAVLAATVYESPLALNSEVKAPYQAGMYVSFAGALLLIAGGVLGARATRPRAQRPAVPETGSQPAPPATGPAT